MVEAVVVPVTEIELKRARAALEHIRDDLAAIWLLVGDDRGGDAA